MARSLILSLFSLWFIFSPSSIEATDVSLEKSLQKLLEENRRIILKAIGKLKSRSSIADEITKIKANTGDIRAADLRLQEQFTFTHCQRLLSPEP